MARGTAGPGQEPAPDLSISTLDYQSNTAACADCSAPHGWPRPRRRGHTGHQHKYAILTLVTNNGLIHPTLREALFQTTSKTLRRFCIILCVTHTRNQNHISLFITSIFILYSYSIHMAVNPIDNRPYSKLSISVNSLGTSKMEIKMTF